MDVRAFLVLYIGRDGLLPMQSVIPAPLNILDDDESASAPTQVVIEFA